VTAPDPDSDPDLSGVTAGLDQASLAAHAAVGAEYGLSGETHQLIWNGQNETIEDERQAADLEKLQNEWQEYRDQLEDLGLTCRIAEQGFDIAKGGLGTADGAAGHLGTIAGSLLEFPVDCP
jgi:hypothetical protein